MKFCKLKILNGSNLLTQNLHLSFFVIIDILHKSNIKNYSSDTNIDQKGKLTCENSFSFSWINYFSATSITRIKVIFHSTNVFVNLVKLMQRVKKG